MSRAGGSIGLVHGHPDTGPRPSGSARARAELGRALARSRYLDNFGTPREREVAARRVAEARAIVLGLASMRMEDGLPEDIAAMPLRRSSE